MNHPKMCLSPNITAVMIGRQSFGFYEGLTEIGFIIGLAAGMVLFASALSFSALSTYSFYLCSALNVVALVLAVLLIADPLMIFERRLVGIERKLDFSHRGFEGSSDLWMAYDGMVHLNKTVS